MKPGIILFASLIVSVITSAAILTLAGGEDDEASLQEKTDLETQVLRCRERLGELDDQVHDLRQENKRLRRQLENQTAALQQSSGLLEDFMDLKMDVASLRDQLAEGPGLSAALARRSSEESGLKRCTASCPPTQSSPDRLSKIRKNRLI